MKKIISLLMILVLCIACISAPAYAEDLDTPEEPVDIDEYVIQPCSGSDTVYFFNNKLSVTVYVNGSATLNGAGNPVSFSCSSCWSSESYDNGFGTSSVNYTGYSISGGTIYAYFSYSVYYQDINGGEYSTSGNGSVAI